MIQEVGLIEIDWLTFWVRLIGSRVQESKNVVAEGLAISLDKPLEWVVGFLGNAELSIGLWATIAGYLGSTIEGADALP